MDPTNPEARFASYPDQVDAPVQTDASPDKQSELKLNIGIAVIAAPLCFFVAVVFAWVLHTWVAAVVFAVIGVVCLGILARAYQRKRRAR